jgi:hypothetical protein
MRTKALVGCGLRGNPVKKLDRHFSLHTIPLQISEVRVLMGDLGRGCRVFPMARSYFCNT